MQYLVLYDDGPDDLLRLEALERHLASQQLPENLRAQVDYVLKP